MVFSCIASDNDSEILGTDVVVFLLDLLKKAVALADHTYSVSDQRYDYFVEFSATELLECLHYVVVNDANKRLVLKNNGIPVITRMLQSEFTDTEQHAAAKTLWNLSFDDTVRQCDDMKKACKGGYLFPSLMRYYLLP